MIQRVLSHHSLTGLSCFGLILFLSVFIGVLVWVFRRGGAEQYAFMQQMPLGDLEPIEQSLTREIQGE